MEECQIDWLNRGGGLTGLAALERTGMRGPLWPERENNAGRGPLRGDRGERYDPRGSRSEAPAKSRYGVDLDGVEVRGPRLSTLTQPLFLQPRVTLTIHFPGLIFPCACSFSYMASTCNPLPRNSGHDLSVKRIMSARECNTSSPAWRTFPLSGKPR